jgi:malonyl-CoA decarboxylase
MVNYLYDPKTIEANHQALAQDGTVVSSPEVDALLVAAAPSVRIAAPGLTPLRFPRRLRPQSDR